MASALEGTVSVTFVIEVVLVPWHWKVCWSKEVLRNSTTSVLMITVVQGVAGMLVVVVAERQGDSGKYAYLSHDWVTLSAVLMVAVAG